MKKKTPTRPPLRLLALIVCAAAKALQGQSATFISSGVEGVPVPWSSPHPGGWDARAAAERSLHPRPIPLTGPIFKVTAVKVVDENDNPISPSAGAPFWVEVDWEYDNPTCANYTVARVVNGWTNIATPINWGCGYAGATDWYQYWGPWLMYKAGSYPITVTVDPANAISPSSPSKSKTINVTVGGTILPQWALIDAEFGRTNLGMGTDVIVGTMDDAFDFQHPWFRGNDSLGRPRLVAAHQNSLGIDGSPTNDTHSTGVMGIVLARGANNGDITGLAPDARYVSAECLNRANVPGLQELSAPDGANFCLTNKAEILNMPWSWWTGSDTDSETGEAPITALMADYLAYASNILCVAYVNELTNPTIPTAPGSARNVITVGGLDANLQEAWNGDNFGPTLDGRCKPDILGDGATNCIAPFWDWREGFPATYGFWGNSFAGPFVTGTAAEILDYAKHHGLNHDHRLVKALIMNSGVAALNDIGQPWTNSLTVPLDQQQGTGILNLRRLYAMCSAGQQTGAVATPGFDSAAIYGTNISGNFAFGATNGVVSYRLGSPAAFADLDVTLAWDRHTYWSDLNHNGIIDFADTFYVDTNHDAQSILNLTLFRDGAPVAASRSAVDTVQHLHLSNLPPGAYELHVERVFKAGAGNSETYGLAWYSTVTWTNLPPRVALQSATLPGNNTATLRFQLLSGQAGGFQLQTASSLSTGTPWTALPNIPVSQVDSNTFQIQTPLSSNPSQFFRIAATP